jgi:hypothetical protein
LLRVAQHSTDLRAGTSREASSGVQDSLQTASGP